MMQGNNSKSISFGNYGVPKTRATCDWLLRKVVTVWSQKNMFLWKNKILSPIQPLGVFLVSPWRTPCKSHGPAGAMMLPAVLGLPCSGGGRAGGPGPAPGTARATEEVGGVRKYRSLLHGGGVGMRGRRAAAARAAVAAVSGAGGGRPVERGGYQPAAAEHLPGPLRRVHHAAEPAVGVRSGGGGEGDRG